MLASDLLVIPDVCIIILFYSVPLVVWWIIILFYSVPLVFWWQNYPFRGLQILEHCGNSKQPHFVEVTIPNPCMLSYYRVIRKVSTTVFSTYEIKQRMMDNWSKNNQQHISLASFKDLYMKFGRYLSDIILMLSPVVRDWKSMRNCQ